MRRASFVVSRSAVRCLQSGAAIGWTAAAAAARSLAACAATPDAAAALPRRFLQTGTAIAPDPLLHLARVRTAPVSIQQQQAANNGAHAPVPLAYRRTLIDGAATAPLRVPASAGAADAHSLLAAHEHTDGKSPLVVPVVLLHCLLGDSTQWRLLEMQLHRALQAQHAAASSSPSPSPSRRVVFDCWMPDARNHGASPHCPTHSYAMLANDVRQFVRAHRLKRPVVAGHSMGGKTALAYSLTVPSDSSDAPRALVIFDAAPAAYTHQHSAIFGAMKALPLHDQALRQRRQAEERLRALLPSPSDRAFVLTNLVDAHALALLHQHHPHASHASPAVGEGATGAGVAEASGATASTAAAGLAWRINLPVLARCEREVHGFPLPPPPALSLSGVGPFFPRSALFIGGGKSTRLTTAAYLESLPGYFPHHTLHMLPTAAHFVHQSHAKECAQWMSDFILAQTDSQLQTEEASSTPSSHVHAESRA